MSKNYESIIRRDFPALSFEEFRLIDNAAERIWVDNISFRMPDNQRRLAAVFTDLISACTGNTILYSATELAQDFNSSLMQKLGRYNPEETMLVFPGNGALDVQQLLDPYILTNFRNVRQPDVRRNVGLNMSVLGVEVVPSEISIPGGIRRCVLIDDVIAGGTTAEAVRSSIALEDQSDWDAASWMSLSPIQSRARKTSKSSLPGYDTVLSRLIYHGQSGVPANNSLSTFAETSDKAELVIARYKEKYVHDLVLFDAKLLELRRIVYE